MYTKKTPETLSAAQRASSLGIANTEAPTNMKANERNANYANQAKAALNIGLPTLKANTSAQAPNNMNPNFDPDGSFMVLSIHDLESYSKNPRTRPNPRYNEIKDSIRADGITNILTVTRRPGAKKYHPYGGGNTRLKIATELFAEGDQRFAHLTVIAKKWTGDSNVISAHLVENEMRGDISFWEKAQGVALFKAECETEIGKPLTASELNKELRQHGINFGIKVLQNFSFAIEHLAPIGPWLQATAVNASIRPCVAGVLQIGVKFDKGTAVSACIQGIFAHYATNLKAAETYNKENVDPADQKPVQLDSEALLQDIQAALAQELAISVDLIPLWISAIENNDRIDAATLKSIQVYQPPSKPTPPVNRFHPSLIPDPVQQPLGGMLGLAQPPALKPGQQEASNASPGPGPGDASGANHRVKDLPPQIKRDSPLVPVLSLLREISDMVMLNDVVLAIPELPYGYLMDMPVDLCRVDGMEVPYPALRGAVWKFLVSLSHQLDPSWMAKVDPLQSTWVHLLAQGAQAFTESYGRVFGSRTDDFGNPEVGLGEIAAVFGQPELASLVIQLLQSMEQLRISHPERFVVK